MRITVFGATGRMGHLLVGQALDAGHAITAYARNPERLRIGHPNLSVLAGELDNDEAVLAAVQGADAVIEGVGAVSDGTRRIVAAMDESGVRRLVAGFQVARALLPVGKHRKLSRQARGAQRRFDQNDVGTAILRNHNS